MQLYLWSYRESWQVYEHSYLFRKCRVFVYVLHRGNFVFKSDQVLCLSVLVLVNSRNRRPFWTSQGYAGSWLARFNEQACPLGKRSFLARLLWICNPNLFCKHFSSLNLTDDLFRSFSNILSYINNTLKSIFRQFLMSMSFMTNYYNNCPYICSRMF